jgi:hypothetical protein
MEHENTATTAHAANEGKPGCQWYYLLGEEHFGPINTENLVKAIASGQLSKETHVFREGLSEWVHASQCPELCAAPSVKLPSAPGGLPHHSTPKPAWVLWWPCSLLGNILLSGPIAWLLVYFCNGTFETVLLIILTFYVSFLLGRVCTALVRNRIAGLPLLAFASIRTLAHRRQLPQGIALGSLLASLVFAITLTNELQRLNTQKRDTLSSASAAEAQLKNMTSSEYKQNLLAEGMIRAAAGDENGIRSRVAQENDQLESYAQQATALTRELRSLVKQMDWLRTLRLYVFGLGLISFICSGLFFFLPRSANLSTVARI